MKTERILDVLILSDFVVAVSAIATDFALEPFLPAPLRAYLAAERAAASTMADIALMAVWGAVMVGTVLAWVGLVNRWKAARPLYLGSWVGYLVFIVLTGPAVSSGVGHALEMLMALVGGTIVGVTYFSDLRTRLGKLSRSGDERVTSAA